MRKTVGSSDKLYEKSGKIEFGTVRKRVNPEDRRKCYLVAKIGFDTSPRPVSEDLFLPLRSFERSKRVFESSVCASGEPRGGERGTAALPAMRIRVISAQPPAAAKCTGDLAKTSWWPFSVLFCERQGSSFFSEQ